MKVLALIRNCGQCPHERYFTGPDHPGRECREADYREITVSRGVPKWCPLETYNPAAKAETVQRPNRQSPERASDEH